MVQDVVDSQSKSEIARVAIGKMPGGKPALDITMPLGVALEPGVGLSLGTTNRCAPRSTAPARSRAASPTSRSMTRCRPRSNAGKDGKLLFAGANDDKPIAIPLSLKGYGDAKRAYNSGEAKRASWFWRMWS